MKLYAAKRIAEQRRLRIHQLEAELGSQKRKAALVARKQKVIDRLNKENKALKRLNLTLMRLRDELLLLQRRAKRITVEKAKTYRRKKTGAAAPVAAEDLVKKNPVEEDIPL
jgi:hypothetical protein